MMKISGTIWLDDVVDKLHRKHNVEPEEVEEVLAGRPTFRRLETGRVRGEDLFAALGRTEAGRYLAVFFVHKATHQALVVSARAMTQRERRLYGKS